MDLFFRIRAMLESAAAGIRVQELVFGDHITVLRLENGKTGAAMHFAPDWPENRRREESRELMRLDARQLLERLGFAHPLQASAAVAAANALISGQEGPRPGHMLDVLDLRADDVFGMVGNFIPLVDRIRPRVKQLMIFETIEQPTADGILPACEESRLLPECSVVLITGTTLVNGTIGDLLYWCRGARMVVVAGPSTILLPEAWRGTPVTWLAGSRILDPETVLARVARGESFRELRPLLEKVVLPVPR